MVVYSEMIKIKTVPGKFYNITGQVLDIVRRSEVFNGLCNVFCPSTTGAIILNECEPMLEKDMNNILEEVIPKANLYHHSSNAYSHIKSALMGASQTFPVESSVPTLGAWQHVVFCEFDSRERERTIIVTVTGDQEY